MKKNISIFFTIALLISLLTGCSSTAPVVRQRFFWPPPPEQPRIEWIGRYQSNLDLNEQSAAKSALSFLTGETEKEGLNTPNGIASNGKGKVYITDKFRGGVVVFDFNAKDVYICGGDILMGAFKLPWGIDLDNDGNIYVGDTAQSTITVLSPQEQLLRTIKFKDLKGLSIFRIDKKRNRIIIPDPRGHKIIISNLDGTVIKTIQNFKNKGVEDRFNFPLATAVTSKGNILVADGFNARIVRFTPEGEFISAWGTRGATPGTIDLMHSFAVDSDDHVYVVDSRSNQLNIFSETGEALLAIGQYNLNLNAIGSFDMPNDIYIDNNDAIYIIEKLARRFQIMQYLNPTYLAKNPILKENIAKPDVTPTKEQ